MPIDFIIFEEEQVVFLEVKSGNAFLTQRQKQIKELIQQKKVRWEEYRVNGKVQQTPEVQGLEKTEVPGVPEGVRLSSSETGAQENAGNT